MKSQFDGLVFRATIGYTHCTVPTVTTLLRYWDTSGILGYTVYTIDRRAADTIFFYIQTSRHIQTDIIQRRP